MDNQRNLLLAVALSGLLIFGWDFALRYFYPEASTAAPTEEVAPAAAGTAASATGSATPASDGTLDGAAAAPTGPVNLDKALASASRVKIDAPRMAGSINLVGAQIDDIVLKDHRQKVEKDSGPVRLFAPRGTDAQYFAQFGWVGDGIAFPTTQTLWTADNTTLTAQAPVTLSHDNGTGQLFAIRLEVDDNYMLTVTQSVQNTGENSAVVQPIGYIERNSETPLTSENAQASDFIAHTGPIGVFGDTLDDSYSYDDVAEEAGRKYTPAGKTAWQGFSDQYWLSALIPGEGATTSDFSSLDASNFRTQLSYDAKTLASGSSLSQKTQLFVGAKESTILDNYEEGGITLFGKAISWGWFQIIEKPLLWLLKHLFAFAGNFGVAIILLTCIIRGLMFPIAQKQFASMAGMKAVQPKMKAIQERFKDDKQKQQQEIMKLYKDEGVNPLAGCFPLLIQIPIFFALYKVLILAIEMRHEPFVFWLKDLSAPDPAKILNLFGLLPFDPPGFLGIGILAVLLGLTMWMTFKLNPSAMDPMQQQIFNFMPWILMFVMAGFASGLLLYWVTSNILTLAQQKYLYSKHPQLKAAAEQEKLEKAREAAKEAKDGA
ncbi:MAG: membrane protein insertase YidC [Erythrobacter sp.]